MKITHKMASLMKSKISSSQLLVILKNTEKVNWAMGEVSCQCFLLFSMVMFLTWV